VSLESKLLFIEACFSYMAHLFRSEFCWLVVVWVGKVSCWEEIL